MLGLPCCVVFEAKSLLVVEHKMASIETSANTLNTEIELVDATNSPPYTPSQPVTSPPNSPSYLSETDQIFANSDPKDSIVRHVSNIRPFLFESLILYLPMWCTSLPSSERRSVYCSWMIIFITTLFIGFFCLYGIYTNYIRIYDDLMLGICTSLRLLLFTIARFYSIYYFAKHFRFPWRSDTISGFNQIEAEEDVPSRAGSLPAFVSFPR